MKPKILFRRTATFICMIITMLTVLTPIAAHADGISTVINQSHLGLTLISFFGIGILLAFTPCVLPMVPILSSILIGQEETGSKRAFSLSLAFVLSMALTYALVGMLAGYIGSTLQTIMQTPWVIISFSLLFVLMALSMFDYFHLSLPAFLQTNLHQMNNKLKQGKFVSVAIMGVLSTLIASPCVTAPLISVLTFISQTGSMALGGLILFSLALGMGLPLILFGIGQAAILPKTGNWMNNIKSLFGVMMLGLAIWMMSRILPGNITLFLWAGLLIVSTVAFGTLDFHMPKRLPPILHGINVFALVFGILLLVGAASGHDGFLNPLSSIISTSENEAVTSRPPSALFGYTSTMSNLQEKLRAAQKANKPVMIEFFASWCPDCKQVDKEVLSDKSIQKSMRAFSAIRVDVSERNSELAKMMEEYKVYGVPTMIFYDRKGKLFNAEKLNDGITKENLEATLNQLS